MTFRIASVTLELETIYIVQQRYMWFFWGMPYREFTELVEVDRLRSSGHRDFEKIYKHIQFASVADAAKAIDTCRKRLDMFSSNQLKHEETR